MRLSGSPTEAEAENTRKVEARASSRPPPSAIEDIAQIEGMGREERLLKVWRKEVRKSVMLIYVIGDESWEELGAWIVEAKWEDDCDRVGIDRA